MFKVVVNSCYGGFGLSSAAEEWLTARGADPESFYYNNRHDPLLVECVLALGEEAASGPNASLEVECHEGCRYVISEYDGLESVSTPESTKWVQVAY